MPSKLQRRNKLLSRPDEIQHQNRSDSLNAPGNSSTEDLACRKLLGYIIRFDQWKQAFNNVGGVEKFPMINKFYDPNPALAGNNEFAYTSSRDIFLFWLAETYLIAAEAYFKLGQLDNAAEKLNALGGRAAKAGESLAITSGEVTLDFILDERARELAGEYKR